MFATHMNTCGSTLRRLIFLSAVLALCACGEPDPPMGMSISGSVGGEALAEHPGQPVMLLVARGNDVSAILNDPLNSVIAYVGVNPSDNTFHVDLSDRGLTAGDQVFIAAFIDLSPADRAPFPDTGDIIGFWIDPATLSISYTLAQGDNSGLNIHISREIFDFSAAVTGRILGTENGDVTLIAYAGAIASLDSAAIDPDKIVGFSRLEIQGAPVDYVLPILPFGYNVPIEEVRILALLDADENGGMNAGDKIGYFTMGPPYLPAALTIPAGVTAGIDLGFLVTVADRPSGTEPLEIHGELIVPGQTAVPGPLFVMVATDEANPYDLDSIVQNLRHFQRLPDNTLDFHLDLSDSGLKPGDGVLVVGLWDPDNQSGLPEPTAGDMVGFYVNPATGSPVLTLTAGTIDNILVAITQQLTGQ
ncbi:MAG: hypothetical protein ACOZF0_05450 [Thermodesulfobacteriota bacterium]